MERISYIYGLLDPFDGSIRYVGQAMNVPRRSLRHVHDTARAVRQGRYLSVKERWISLLMESGIRPSYRILGIATTKKDIDDFEKSWIARLSSEFPGTLTNTAKGGGGTPGISPSDLTRQRITATKTGRKASPAELDHIRKLANIRRGQKMKPESIEKTRAANTGRAKTKEEIEKLRSARKGLNFSAAWIANMSKAQKNMDPELRKQLGIARRGWKHKPETIERIVAANRGKKRTPEHIAIIRSTHTGKVLSAETRAKISASRLGKKLSPEHREKSIARLSVIWERRRQEKKNRASDPRQAVLF